MELMFDTFPLDKDLAKNYNQSMRKNKAGRPSKIEDIKKKVSSLRKANLSFAEIADTLGISRQLAFYHSKKLSTGKVLDKEL